MVIHEKLDETRGSWVTSLMRPCCSTRKSKHSTQQITLPHGYHIVIPVWDRRLPLLQLTFPVQKDSSVGRDISLRPQDMIEVILNDRLGKKVRVKCK